LTIALPARAKLNLDLEVIRLRDDGYHEIRTTIQEIDLHDLLEISPARETAFTSLGFPVPQDNTVVRAHSVLERMAGRELPARFHLHKLIPPGSGMGGASSDAAAALRGLRKLHRLDIDLAPAALEVGADVPFFLVGGTAKAEGRGERITRLGTAPRWFAVAWPGVELATKDVYGAWDTVKGAGPNQLRRAAEKVEPRLEEFAKRLGAGWQMTGSGSAFFRGFALREAAAQAAATLDCWTVVTRAVGGGAGD
jgi:4-diphosphocytidyl-2-C-methyl-D-erythritol kinase